MTAAHNSSPKPARRRFAALATFVCAARPWVRPAWAQATDWPMVNLNYEATRYSPLDQITTANVGQLKVAWVYHLKPASAAAAPAPATAPANGRPRFTISPWRSSEDQPLVIGGVMFVASPYGRIVALDPETGREKWVFEIPDRDTPSLRGVS